MKWKMLEGRKGGETGRQERERWGSQCQWFFTSYCWICWYLISFDVTMFGVKINSRHTLHSNFVDTVLLFCMTGASFIRTMDLWSPESKKGAKTRGASSSLSPWKINSKKLLSLCMKTPLCLFGFLILFWWKLLHFTRKCSGEAGVHIFFSRLHGITNREFAFGSALSRRNIFVFCTSALFSMIFFNFGGVLFTCVMMTQCFK